MKVDEATVRNIARLARLKVSDAEAESLQKELTSILDWIEQLGEVDTDGVEPLRSIVETEMYQRDDVISDGGYPEQIMKNAPMSEDNFFMVPKVVE